MFENIFNTIMDVKGKIKDNIESRMDMTLFFHRKNIKLVYAGSQVIKIKTNFALDKNAQLLVYQSKLHLRVNVFLMDMPRIYHSWLIWRITNCMEGRAMMQPWSAAKRSSIHPH